MSIQKIISISIVLILLSININLYFKVNTYKDNLKLEYKKYEILRETILIQESIIDSLRGKQEDIIRKRADILSGIKIPKTFPIDHLNVVLNECKEYDIPPRIAFRLIQKESNFRPNAKSSAGANGYMQIMPVTYKGYSKKLGISDSSPESNIKVGMFYLKTLYGYFDRRENLSSEEKWRLTLFSYNFGISRVGKNREKFLGPQYKNYNYVNFIMS